MKIMKKHALTLGLAVLLPFSQANAEKVSLNWALWSFHQTMGFSALIDAYETKNPDVTINPIDLGTADYNSMVLTQLTGGASNLDIITVKDSPGYANMIRLNTVLDLSDEFSSVQRKNTGYSSLIDTYTVEDKIYAMPFRSSFWLVYYNKDIFDKAGVAYPTNEMSLAEFDAKAEKVTSGMGVNKVYGTFLHTWRSTIQLPAILDGKHSLVEKNYDFLIPYYERALKLQDEGTIPKYASLKTSNTHYSGPWFNSTVAMMPMGSWFIATQIAKVQTGESSAVNWGLVRMPQPEGVESGTTAAQITSIAVNKNSKHQKWAIDFAKFASSPEGAAIVASVGEFPAMMNDRALGNLTKRDGFPQDENSQAAVVINKTYLEMPVDLDGPKVEVVLNRGHDAIMTESMSIQDGIAEINQDMQKILN